MMMWRRRWASHAVGEQHCSQPFLSCSPALLKSNGNTPILPASNQPSASATNGIGRDVVRIATLHNVYLREDGTVLASQCRKCALVRSVLAATSPNGTLRLR